MARRILIDRFIPVELSFERRNPAGGLAPAMHRDPSGMPQGSRSPVPAAAASAGRAVEVLQVPVPREERNAQRVVRISMKAKSAYMAMPSMASANRPAKTSGIWKFVPATLIR